MCWKHILLITPHGVWGLLKKTCIVYPTGIFVIVIVIVFVI